MGSPLYMSPEQMRVVEGRRRAHRHLGARRHPLRAVCGPARPSRADTMPSCAHQGRYRSRRRRSATLPAGRAARARGGRPPLPREGPQRAAIANVAELAVALSPFAPPRRRRLGRAHLGHRQGGGARAERQRLLRCRRGPARGPCRLRERWLRSASRRRGVGEAHPRHETEAGRGRAIGSRNRGGRDAAPDPFETTLESCERRPAVGPATQVSPTMRRPLCSLCLAFAFAVVSPRASGQTQAAAPTTSERPLDHTLQGAAKDAYGAAKILFNRQRFCRGGHQVQPGVRFLERPAAPLQSGHLRKEPPPLRAHAEPPSAIRARPGAAPIAPDDKAAVDAALVAIRNLVVLVRLAVTPAGASVWVDGQPAGTTMLLAEPLRLDSSAHTRSASRREDSRRPSRPWTSQAAARPPSA